LSNSLDLCCTSSHTSWIWVRALRIWSCQIHLDSLNLNKAGATLSLSIKNGVGFTLTGVPSLHCNEEQKEIVGLRILSCQIHLNSYLLLITYATLNPTCVFFVCVVPSTSIVVSSFNLCNFLPNLCFLFLYLSQKLVPEECRHGQAPLNLFSQSRTGAKLDKS
jgi:hypothetical protein